MVFRSFSLLAWRFESQNVCKSRCVCVWECIYFVKTKIQSMHNRSLQIHSNNLQLIHLNKLGCKKTSLSLSHNNQTMTASKPTALLSSSVYYTGTSFEHTNNGQNAVVGKYQEHIRSFLSNFGTYPLVHYSKLEINISTLRKNLISNKFTSVLIILN